MLLTHGKSIKKNTKQSKECIIVRYGALEIRIKQNSSYLLLKRVLRSDERTFNNKIKCCVFYHTFEQFRHI